MSHVLGRLLLEFKPYWTSVNPPKRHESLGYQALLVLGSYLLLAVSLRSPAGLPEARRLLWWGLYIE